MLEWKEIRTEEKYFNASGETDGLTEIQEKDFRN